MSKYDFKKQQNSLFERLKQILLPVLHNNSNRFFLYLSMRCSLFFNHTYGQFFHLCYPVIHSGIAWIEFLNSMDNLGDILTHLREGDLKGAQLIWLRYEVKNSSVRSVVKTNL